MKQLKTTSSIALFFFAIGTLLFVLQIIIRGITGVTILGYYYVMVSIIINLIIIVILLISLLIERKLETLKSIGIILANIPIAYLYFYIVTKYLIQ